MRILPPCTCLKNTFVYLRFFSSKMKNLENLNFDNIAVRRLPIDPIKDNYVRTVNDACFSKVMPTPVKNPKVVAVSLDAMALLDLPESELERDDFAEYFSGNKILPGSEPAAHCYCGHQFRYFTGQLGDGAAMYLGEILNEKKSRWEIQLKGAGLTPYSRTADGRKVLRSSIREFLCSEAMHYLGIPTTRAGVCITSDSEVVRDIFYDNHPKKEKCSIVLRIAPTFIRFGSFEIFKTLDPITRVPGPSVGRTDMLHTMLDYVIETFYPDVHEVKDTSKKYQVFFQKVVFSTARLAALWKTVGFCHGVLNTDNMSILGLTLDYGPFGFLDMYDPAHICNASDTNGLYCFSRQSEACFWNLKKLAGAIQQALPLNISSPILNDFEGEFIQAYVLKMREKLGFIASKSSHDKALVEDLLLTMENTGADYTNTFVTLSNMTFPNLNDTESITETAVNKLIENCYPLSVLIAYNQADIGDMHIEALKALSRNNPDIFDRLGAGMAGKRLFAQLRKIETFEKMSAQDKVMNDRKLWKEWFSKYIIRVKVDFDACHSNYASYLSDRQKAMKSCNPRFILRNHILQAAIEKAESGDFSEVQKVLNALQKPFDHDSYEKAQLEDESLMPSTSNNSILDCHSMCDKAPNWAFSIKVT